MSDGLRTLRSVKNRIGAAKVAIEAGHSQQALDVLTQAADLIVEYEALAKSFHESKETLLRAIEHEAKRHREKLEIGLRCDMEEAEKMLDEMRELRRQMIRTSKVAGQALERAKKVSE